MDEVGGCHDTLKASEGEIKKMKHGSTQAFDPWNKKDTRNAFHRKRNRDISTFCDVISRKIPPIKKYSLPRTDSAVDSLVYKKCIDSARCNLTITVGLPGMDSNTRVCVCVYMRKGALT